MITCVYNVAIVQVTLRDTDAFNVTYLHCPCTIFRPCHCSNMASIAFTDIFMSAPRNKSTTIP